MNKFVIIFLSAIFLNGVAFAEENKIVATYKGGEVRESQIMQQFKSALEMQPANKGKKFSEFDSSLQEALVRGYINVQLLNAEAVKLKIESSKEFQDKLNNVKSQLVQQELIDSRVKSIVTDELIASEYKKLVEGLKGQEEVKVSHILVDSEEKAKEIKKKLSKGTKFSVLVKESSKDEGSKTNEGEIGYVTKGQLVPEFEEKAFAMKVNEISDPVKTQFGWHIIKVLDRRPAQIPTLENEKASITAKLARDAIEKYVTDLANQADIKLNLIAKPDSK